MQTSMAGLSLIEESEGFRAEAYLDARSPPVWTIGYGHTRHVHPGDTCTPEVADAWLREDLRAAEQAVNDNRPQCGQHQFDALVDFAFNEGEANLQLLLEDGVFLDPSFFLHFTRTGTAHPPGLRIRRQKEMILFQTPDDSVPDYSSIGDAS